jgi:hypothetical protein
MEKNLQKLQKKLICRGNCAVNAFINVKKIIFIEKNN